MDVLIAAAKIIFQKTVYSAKFVRRWATTLGFAKRPTMVMQDLAGGGTVVRQIMQNFSTAVVKARQGSAKQSQDIKKIEDVNLTCTRICQITVGGIIIKTDGSHVGMRATTGIKTGETRV